MGEVSDFMSHRELILRFILCLEFPPAWRTQCGAEGSATVQANTVVVDVYLEVYLYNSGTFEGPEGDPIYIYDRIIIMNYHNTQNKISTTAVIIRIIQHPSLVGTPTISSP